VAILGPTASGKSALALALAERLGNVEIICCDSVQVYRGMDIGSAKPTPDEQARVPHHGLDLVDPRHPFDASAWAHHARTAIAAIRARGHLPLIVGGTGLYYRALTQGLFQAPPPSAEIRQRHKEEAAREGVPALHARLAEVDPTAAAGIMPTDLVRISRALEVHEQTGVPISELWRAARPADAPAIAAVVLDPPLDRLRARIGDRVDAMMALGFLDEVRSLRAHGFGNARALGALGYRELGLALDGALTVPVAVEEIKKNTAAYARRQRTWFRKLAAHVRIASDPDVAGLAAEVARVSTAPPGRP
jgi:tRNA dimethylallyltransferase